MMAHVNCPKCSKRLRLPPIQKKQGVRCPACKHEFAASPPPVGNSLPSENPTDNHTRTAPPQETSGLTGLFHRKQKVQLEEFCREFYDENIFTSAIGSWDIAKTYAECVKNSISEVDRTFAAIDTELLHAEMTLIRFEVFSLAWLHQIGDKHAAAQNAFTKQYLESHNRAEIWDALEPYNQAIARSSTLGKTTETASGRAYLTSVDNKRMDMFERWYEQGIEPKVVARGANHLATEVAWKEGLTAGFLMLTLCQRLGCEVNDQGQSRLVAAIQVIYDESREALKRIRIQS